MSNQSLENALKSSKHFKGQTVLLQPMVPLVFVYMGDALLSLRKGAGVF